MDGQVGVILFDSTSAAFRAEKVLKDLGLRVKLIPTPRQLSSDCGAALRFDVDRLAEVESLLHQYDVPIASVHMM
jgi:hypothetical protein